MQVITKKPIKILNLSFRDNRLTSKTLKNICQSIGEMIYLAEIYLDLSENENFDFLCLKAIMEIPNYK